MRKLFASVFAFVIALSSIMLFVPHRITASENSPLKMSKEQLVGIWNDVDEWGEIVLFNNGQCIVEEERTEADVLEKWYIDGETIYIAGQKYTAMLDSNGYDNSVVLIDEYGQEYEPYYSDSNTMSDLDILMEVYDFNNAYEKYDIRSRICEEKIYSCVTIEQDGSFWVDVDRYGDEGRLIRVDRDWNLLDIDSYGRTNWIVDDKWGYNFFDKILATFDCYYADQNIRESNEKFIAAFEDSTGWTFWVAQEIDTFDSHECILRAKDINGNVKAEWSDVELANKYDLANLQSSTYPFYSRMSYYEGSVYLIGNSYHTIMLNVENGIDADASAFGSSAYAVSKDDGHIYVYYSDEIAAWDMEGNKLPIDEKYLAGIAGMQSIGHVHPLGENLVFLSNRDGNHVVSIDGYIPFDASRFDMIYPYHNGIAAATLTNPTGAKFFTLIDLNGEFLFEPIQGTYDGYCPDMWRYQYRLGGNGDTYYLCDKNGNTFKVPYRCDVFIRNENGFTGYLINDGDVEKYFFNVDTTAIEEDIDVSLSTNDVEANNEQTESASNSAVKVNSIEASSVFKNYIAEYAIDNDPTTAWFEGAEGVGTGEYLTFSVETEQIAGIAILPGYTKNSTVYTENAVPELLLIESGKSKEVVDISDFSPDFKNLKPAYYTFAEPIPVENGTIKVMILSAKKGTKSEHTGISELYFLNDMAAEEEEDVKLIDAGNLYMNVEDIIGASYSSISGGLTDGTGQHVSFLPKLNSKPSSGYHSDTIYFDDSISVYCQNDIIQGVAVNSGKYCVVNEYIGQDVREASNDLSANGWTFLENSIYNGFLVSKYVKENMQVFLGVDINNNESISSTDPNVNGNLEQLYVGYYYKDNAASAGDNTSENTRQRDQRLFGKWIMLEYDSFYVHFYENGLVEVGSAIVNTSAQAEWWTFENKVYYWWGDEETSGEYFFDDQGRLSIDGDTFVRE